MKQVRLFTLAAAMFMTSQLLMASNGPKVTARIITNSQLNPTYPRALSSMAFDTYGNYQIRVWIDDVLINKSPMSYVEIPRLRAGYRWVDIEVMGRRGSRFITENVYIQPGTYSLFAVEPGSYRGMYVMTALQSRPYGYVYTGRRRTSVKFGSVYHGGGHLYVDIDHNHHGHSKYKNKGHGKSKSHSNGNEREYSRGGNHNDRGNGTSNNSVRDHGQGRGNGQDNGNGNNGVRDHGQGRGTGNGQGTGNGSGNGNGRRGS